MQTENDTSKPEDSPQQEACEGCSGATCSASFTPGPWYVRPRKGPGGITAEVCYGTDECITDGVYEIADAKLIAAAPDILSALIHVKNEIGPWKEEPGCNCGDCMMLRPVYAAITKALGPDWQNEKSAAAGSEKNAHE